MLLDGNVITDIIFLDLNTHLVNGQESLAEIRANQKFKNIPIINYSISHSREHIDETFKKGANFYFPNQESFRDFKIMISRIFELNWKGYLQPERGKFILSINHAR